MSLTGVAFSRARLSMFWQKPESCLRFIRLPPVLFTLKLYCHWALHVDLSKPGTTLPFLERVDTSVEGWLAGNSDTRLDSFRNQFRQFLQPFNLPTAVCDEDARWNEFLTHYGGVIEDGSLSCEANALKLVREVVFTKGRIAAGSEDFRRPFRVIWTIIFLSGQELTLETGGFEARWKRNDRWRNYFE
jgi:hypothetical protein